MSHHLSTSSSLTTLLTRAAVVLSLAVLATPVQALTSAGCIDPVRCHPLRSRR